MWFQIEVLGHIYISLKVKVMPVYSNRNSPKFKLFRRQMHSRMDMRAFSLNLSTKVLEQRREWKNNLLQNNNYSPYNWFHLFYEIIWKKILNVL